MPKASKRPASASKAKSRSDSHLYTDDNPSTTLHGTGFKDTLAARRTLQLVSARSLTYQFQTVNTMYHRAKNHPSRNPSIEAAMAVFREWLDVTYPRAKADLRLNGGFKPLLSKDVVKVNMDRIRRELDRDDQRFAEFYLTLPKGKRLANQLLRQEEPGGKDWECERYAVLDRLVPRGYESETAWPNDRLWTQDKRPSLEHLKLIAWAWTPTTAKKVS